MKNVAPLDVFVVDVGHLGLRARRYRREEVLRVDAPSLAPGAGAADLVSAVAPLLPETDPPPVVCVWAIREGSQIAAPELLSRSQAHSRAPAAVVVDGAVATLVGALGEVAAGVVLELGTGVSALATDFDQVWHRIDGWGPILGDRGSAAWLGAQGLAAGLRHRDGVPGGSAALLDAGRRAFGDERTWTELLERLPAAALLADFAPVVGEIARRDPVAEAICRLAGEHLADAMCAGAKLLPGKPLTATGALLLIDAVKVSFAAALGKRRIILLPALGDSLAGAQILATHVAGGGAVRHSPPFIHVEGQAALRSA
ncbi:BadF/BadG/BcrA/BcrD ATPase family protein [Gephyromycinifex aptenodytis]|uniref:BadF/BadG/BcrA/BcrD ATPase family protein n=1 Tax=Gephyromycinifex aptenodytis TaxID=2716227 RepID=UPI0014468E73|nr:BadF/BadG/BcrA/BcrD ATPase family protein [Gephyromycinifex aptenodytis]